MAKCQIVFIGGKWGAYLNHWRLAVKVVLKQLDIDGGRHEDNLEVRALLNEALDNAEKEVAVKMPFVNLV